MFCSSIPHTIPAKSILFFIISPTSKEKTLLFSATHSDACSVVYIIAYLSLLS